MTTQDMIARELCQIHGKRHAVKDFSVETLAVTVSRHLKTILPVGILVPGTFATT